jgi:hypothetical protein
MAPFSWWMNKSKKQKLFACYWLFAWMTTGGGGQTSAPPLQKFSIEENKEIYEILILEIKSVLKYTSALNILVRSVK